jgi:hypothetical protein
MEVLMGYYPVLLLDVVEAIMEKIIEKKDSFSPSIQSVDLDEFWGLASDESEIPLPCVVIELPGGELGEEEDSSSMDSQREDLHRIRINIFSSPPSSGEVRSHSISLISKLAEIFRQDEFTDQLNIPSGQMIKKIRSSGYEPNNTFIDRDIFGWTLNLEIDLSSYYSPEDL